MDEYWNRIKAKIPTDNMDQYTAERLASEFIAGRRGLKILDLGCGDGRAVDFFRSLRLDIQYTGVDIEKSPEVSGRIRDDVSFDSFDGVSLPYANETFDIVYSKQVFEHVANPSDLLKDIRRVLKPEGSFLGSVSQLEPYHSFSLWNYTLYGWDRLLEGAGLNVTLFRPGIDGVTLTMRSIDGRKSRFARYFSSRSPIHQRIKRLGLARGANIK